MLQYGSSTCLLTCPEGYYVNPDSTKCLKCSSSCIGCITTETNCIKCGLINDIAHFLEDTNIANPNIGGVCVTACTGSFYEFKTLSTCVACASGCISCQNTANNCTVCGLDGSGKRYFLQPNSFSCL